MVSHSEIVPLAIDEVWKHFLVKIDQPQHFVPGVSRVEIHERTQDHVIRAMDLTTPDGKAATVVEKITWKPYIVLFEIIDHPVYSGHVENVAEKISEHETRITFTLKWISKQTGEPMKNQDLVRSAVHKTCTYMLKT